MDIKYVTFILDQIIDNIFLSIDTSKFNNYYYYFIYICTIQL